MSRGARLAFENSFLHVFNRGINKQPIFIDSSDYEFFLKKVLALKNKYDHSLYAICLLPNHFHLSIQTRKAPISKIMSSLTTSYSMYFNRVYKHFGPVFQNRFKSILIENNLYFRQLSRYIYLNPVKAGLVDDPLDYQYSSFAEAIGVKPTQLLDTDIIRLIGDTKRDQQEYIKYVYSGISEDMEEFAKLFNQEEVVLGSNQFNRRSMSKYLRRKAK